MNEQKWGSWVSRDDQINPIPVEMKGAKVTSILNGESLYVYYNYYYI